MTKKVDEKFKEKIIPNFTIGVFDKLRPNVEKKEWNKLNSSTKGKTQKRNDEVKRGKKCSNRVNSKDGVE